MSISYSQHGEDLEIAALLPDTGWFLDIGAYRPMELSNTRLLYERGWSGVMFEPSPENMNYLIDEYGYDDRITLVQALVGVTAGVFRWRYPTGQLVRQMLPCALCGPRMATTGAKFKCRAFRSRT